MRHMSFTSPMDPYSAATLSYSAILNIAKDTTKAKVAGDERPVWDRLTDRANFTGIHKGVRNQAGNRSDASDILSVDGADPHVDSTLDFSGLEGDIDSVSKP
jgi:hypothetical protein